MHTKKKVSVQTNWIVRIFLFNFLLLASCELSEDLIPDNTDLPEVSLLNGEWLLIDGNNESAIGMMVSASNGSATVLDPSSTSFSSGDVVWKDVTPSDENLYEHQELGSDGNYYEATIKLINEDEIEINVANSGAGNFQRWVRVASDNELLQLQGTWVIITDNGTVVIELKGSSGRVIYSSDPGYSEGDLLWKDIVYNGSNEFIIQVLNDNGTYTSGSITIITVNQIVIIIGSEDPIPVDRVEESADLSKLQGEWTRIESNNPSADFMKVNVINDQATIIDRAQSSYLNGDIKWKDITNSAPGFFSHKELGSDGNYYDASIVLKNDSTLEITVCNSGSGNTQKWVRNAPARTIVLDCSNISSSTTLVNNGAGVDYRVQQGCVIDITAPLTIEPGVVIEFEENSGLGIYDNGSINAVGNANQPIVFQGKDNVKGYWRGIHVETNSTSNRFEFVELKDAGSNYVYCCNEVASLTLKGGQFALENTTIENGAGIGIYARDNTRISDFSNNTITTHDEYPMSIPLEAAGKLDGLNSDYSGNKQDYIFINDRSLVEETTISATNVPLLFDAVYDVTDGLTILEGTEFVMRENAGLGVYDQGYLKLGGKSGNPVIIRGLERIAGYWRGIHIETKSINNSIDHAEISDAGSDYVYCCNVIATLFYKGGRGSITNTVISNGDQYGIYANRDAEFSNFSNNTVTSHNKYPMYIHFERIGELDGTGSSYSGNSEDYVAIFNSTVDDPIIMRKTSVPYLIDDGVMDITERLEIRPGTEIVFAANTGLGFYDNGIINAEGTGSSNIIFRGKEDEAGYWRGIHTETNSSDNKILHSRISNAGSNYVYCCNQKAGIFVRDGQLEVANSVILDNAGCGIAVRSGAVLSESGNTFSNNEDGNICQ
jgi:hypothetical protein